MSEVSQNGGGYTTAASAAKASSLEAYGPFHPPVWPSVLVYILHLCGFGNRAISATFPGGMPVTQSGAILFFQLINRRYGRASTVLTSNKGFEEWGRILGDEVMAAALLDRLLHRCHVVNILFESTDIQIHL